MEGTPIDTESVNSIQMRKARKEIERDVRSHSEDHDKHELEEARHVEVKTIIV